MIAIAGHGRRAGDGRRRLGRAARRIAVPTSVGYGVSFNGIAALLAMLNSCAPGVSVVNIDNGFGAAVCAHMIVAQASRPARRPLKAGTRRERNECSRDDCREASHTTRAPLRMRPCLRGRLCE